MTVKSELDRQRLSYIAFKYDTGTSTFQGYDGTVWKIIDKVRYNSGTSEFEGWNGTSWVAIGGSSGGSGASLLDPNFDETFVYYTRSDFGIDQDTFFGSTTGTNNILSTGNLVLDKTQNFISSNLLGPMYLSDAPVLNTAQVKLLYNVGKVDNNYTFTVTTANATAGAVYSNNLTNFTVLTTISGGTTLVCSGVKEPAASGTLTKVSGTGDATITFSAVSSLTIQLSADGGSNWTSANAYSRVNSGQFVIADFTFTAGTTSTDLKLKVISGTDDSELAGFGVNLVQDLAQYGGDATFETRIITATEASTGLIALTNVRFTPGSHQLHCTYSGHDFVAPTFTELGGGQVQFPTNFFVAGDTVYFWVSYGLVNTTNAPLTINNMLSTNSTLGSVTIPSGYTLDKPWMDIPSGATVTGSGNIETTGVITGAGVLATTGTVLCTGKAPTQPSYDVVTTQILKTTSQSLLDGKVTINPSKLDNDFIISGMSKDNALRVDASTNRVGFNTDTPLFAVENQNINSALSSAKYLSRTSNTISVTNVTILAASTTGDILRLLNDAGSVLGTNCVSGQVYIYAADWSTGGNAYSSVLNLVTTGNGTSPASFTTATSITRGSSPVTSVQLANDLSGGGVKVTMTTAAGFTAGVYVVASFVGLVV